MYEEKLILDSNSSAPVVSTVDIKFEIRNAHFYLTILLPFATSSISIISIIVVFYKFIFKRFIAKHLPILNNILSQQNNIPRQQENIISPNIPIDVRVTPIAVGQPQIVQQKRFKSEISINIV
jgi:hypothetical protein